VRLDADDPRLRRLVLGQALSAVDVPELGDASAGWVAGPAELVRVAVDAEAAPGRRPAVRPLRVIALAGARQGGEMP
jgi:hypothetical protein